MSDSIIVELDNSVTAKTYAANSANSAVAAASSAASALSSANSAAGSKEVASTAASSIQSMLERGTYSTSIAQLALEESTGYGVISGYGATVSNGIITVSAGIVHLGNGYRYSTASTTFTPTADATNPRYDLIYISSTGVVSILTGTAAASPTVPSMPAGGLALYKALIGISGTITLTDLREFKARYQNLNIVNVVDFGAKCDGVTDDTAAIQAAIDIIANRKAKGVVFIPAGKYKITSKLQIDIAYVSIEGTGAIIDASAITSNEAIWVFGSLYPPFSQSTNYLRGFELIGSSEETTIGVLFDSTTGSTSHTSMQCVGICGFHDGVMFKSHAYIQTLFNVDIHGCTNCVNMPSGATDYGERSSFVACTFYNSLNAIEINNPNGSMEFLQCSIDYTRHVLELKAGAVFMTDCHIESSYWGTGAYEGVSPFKIYQNNGATLSVKGGILLNTASTPSYTSVIENNNSNVDQKISALFNGVFMHSLKNTFSTGEGRTVVKDTLSYYINDLATVVSDKNNLMVNGDFKRNAIEDRIFIIQDTQTITGEPTSGANINLNVSDDHAASGTYSLKVTKTYGGGSSAQFAIACPIPNNAIVGASLKLYAPSTFTGKLWLSSAYEKIDGDKKGTVGTIGALSINYEGISGGFNTIQVVAPSRLVAPAGATHLFIVFNMSELSSTSLYIDDIIVNTY